MTIGSIAEQYGISVELLADYNKLAIDATVKSGQIILVPVNTAMQATEKSDTSHRILVGATYEPEGSGITAILARPAATVIGADVVYDKSANMVTLKKGDVTYSITAGSMGRTFMPQRVLFESLTLQLNHFAYPQKCYALLIQMEIIPPTLEVLTMQSLNDVFCSDRRYMTKAIKHTQSKVSLLETQH